jgi:hypothetical protein
MNKRIRDIGGNVILYSNMVARMRLNLTHNEDSYHLADLYWHLWQAIGKQFRNCSRIISGNMFD